MIKAAEINKEEMIHSAAIGAKLFEARKLCNFSQTMAAGLLGITPENLKLIEDARSGVVPPILIKRASQVFEVSADWILGLVDDDWEQAVETRRERDFLAGLERLHIENHAKVIAKQLEQDQKLQALANAVTTLTQSILGLDTAFLRLWELNQEFADMLGGATFLYQLDQANAAARAATLSLVRAKCIPISAVTNLPQKPEPNIRKHPVKIISGPTTGAKSAVQTTYRKRDHQIACVLAS